MSDNDCTALQVTIALRKSTLAWLGRLTVMTGRSIEDLIESAVEEAARETAKRNGWLNTRNPTEELNNAATCQPDVGPNPGLGKWK